MQTRAQDGRVQSVDRALMLLEALGEHEEGYRLTDLARSTGLSPSTVHRLLTTLEQRRFVQFDPSDNLWHVGRQAFRIGSTFLRERNFAAPALPFLRRLRDTTRETANLGIVDDGDIVVIKQMESREVRRTIARVGGRAPILATGMGKAILSTYAAQDLTTVIGRQGLRKLTRNTLVERPALEAQFGEIRNRGYAVDDEEFALGVRCVASAVYDDRAEPLYAISISGSTQRLTHDRIPAIGRLVAETARELTRSFGGRIPA